MLRSIVLTLSLSVALASPALAVREAATPRERAEAWPPGTTLHADRQEALERSASWRAFRARYGEWRAMWSERAGTPDLATGPSIALGKGLDDAPGVDRAVRGFVAANPAIFPAAAPDLETVRVLRAGSLWYARYRRRIDGAPVLFERWEFRVGAPGRLMAFGVDAAPAPAGLRAIPTLDAAAARQAARAALDLPAGVRVEGGEELAWLPDREGSATRYHLVRTVTARAASPPASWIVLVDAQDGAIRWRHDRLRYDVVGSVTGTVHMDYPDGVPQSQPFAHERVGVAGANVYSGANGVYSSPAPGTSAVESALEGHFCDVYRVDAGNDAAFSTIAQGGLAHIPWSDANSHPAERDGYFHVNRVHDHVKALDAGFTGNDYSMPCVVNIQDICNAYWDGFAVNFYEAGGGCPNTATIPSVVYHEYGHGVNDNLYIDAGAGFGLTNGALHEGLADIVAAFLVDDPLVGRGFFGPGTVLRSCANTLRWPQNASSDPHATGSILAGALWDLRQSVGLPIAEHLSHFAKYGIPDDANDGIAMGRYFVEMLLADDNDANLANGTPHSTQIAAAFGAHGIGTGVFIAIGHAALTDQPGPSPYALQAQISYSGPIGGIDPNSPRVHYSVNGSPFGSVPLSSAGGNDWIASIPAPARSIVRYSLSVADQFGDTRTQPLDLSLPNTFLAGPTTTVFLHDHESNNGWIPGDPSDDASSGRWEWVAPQGSWLGNQIVQTDADHTPTGILCYVTQNPRLDFSPGAHDVDNGHTTLYTSSFDALQAGPDPVIEYWRWYTNNLGSAPGTDLWRVEISNDGGGTWVPVETTPASMAAWQRVVFFVKEFIAPTTLMRMRFIAEDTGAASLVEAAVDDLRLLSFTAGITAVGPGAEAGVALAAPAPNPSASESRFDFRLPNRARASLAIFDLGGRRVRTLVQGVLEAGPHEAIWDGRDEGGAAVASGLYFARLDSPAGSLTRRVVRSR